jgi:predicted Zn finger-like uncharacterized protein
MSILVRCAECSASFRISDEKADKKVRCKECGETFDAEEEGRSPARRVSGNRSRRGSSRAKQPPWKMIVGVGAEALGFFVLIAIVSVGLSRPPREWVADPAQVAALDNEVNLNGYAIRPPRGWNISYQEINGAAPTVTYLWNGPDPRESLTLKFTQRSIYHPNYEPRIITQGMAIIGGADDTFIFHGATHDHGTINGQRFQRIFSPQSISRRGGASSIYLAYFQGLSVQVDISSQQAETSSAFKTLEAAALSFRVGAPSDPRAISVQQLLAANNRSGNINATQGNNVPNINPRPAPINNGNANVAPNVPNGANPAVKKSSAIPELSNVGGGQAAYLSYAYQRPNLPGVYHIYPDETYQPKVVIPLPSGTVSMNRPVTASDFLLLGSQVWNVKTGERVSSLGVKIDHGDFAALSPDGKLIAYRGRGNDSAPIAIFSTETRGQTVELEARKGDARLEWLGFLDANRLMVVWSQWNDTRDNAVQIWNAESGEGLSAFGLGPFTRKDMSVSPDGQQMLFHTSDTVGYVALSSKKPKPTPLPMPDRRALPFLNGLAFSPDNSRAAVYRGGWEGLTILEWDVAKKTIVQNGTIPINAFDIGFNAGQNDPFQWTPDGEHWLLKGHLLLDCQTGNPVWMLQSLFAVYASPIMLDRDTMLVPVQSANRHDNFLVSVPFPWEKIRRATAAVKNPSEPALLRPGASVSMEFNPGPLRFLPADQMAQILGEPLAARLKTFGIKVEANQPTTLYLKYNEQTGDALQVVEKRTPFDIRGTPTGQTVNETRFQLEIGWKQTGSDRIFWKTTSQGSTPRSTNAATVSDQSIHKEMIDHLKRQLNSLMIPYFIPEDESIPLLPVISSR